MKEAKLRDLIAQDISKLKPGLTLLQKEKYIPNEHGTRSFIDLYAIDEKGRHVLIEIKRSNASAREAFHEVIKYVESIKQHLRIKDTEIHVIIASTEWEELLLPYSRFKIDFNYSIEGLEISLDDSDHFRVSNITPLQISQERFIAPWHHVHWYKDKEALLEGISSIEKVYRSRGIKDYIIQPLYVYDSTTPEERMENFKHEIATINGVDPSDIQDLPEFPVYKYIAYVALQILTKKECLDIISKYPSSLEEVSESLSDMGEEEALCFLHEYISSLSPLPKSDYYEIGYPAKFQKFYEAENCELNELIRHGSFKLNTVLNDDTIHFELLGKDGESENKFKRTVDMSSDSEVNILKKDIASVMNKNPIWRNQIQRNIDEIKLHYPKSTIEIYIFNPMTGIFTIYYALTKDMGNLYLPNYYMIVKNPEDTLFFFGALHALGKALNFNQVLDKYYESNLSRLLISLTWGGYEARDSDIIEDLGLQYRSFYKNMKTDEFFINKNEKWRPHDPCCPETLFNNYLKQHQTLVKKIVQEIEAHDKGSFFTF